MLEKLRDSHFDQIQRKYKYRMPAPLYQEFQIAWTELHLILITHIVVYPIVLLIFGDFLGLLMALDWKLSILSVLFWLFPKRLFLNGKLPVYYPKQTVSERYMNGDMLVNFFREGAIVRTVLNAFYFYLLLRPSGAGLVSIHDRRLFTFVLTDPISLLMSILMFLFYVYLLFYKDREITPKEYTKHYDLFPHLNEYARHLKALNREVPMVAQPDQAMIKSNMEIESENDSVYNNGQHQESMTYSEQQVKLKPVQEETGTLRRRSRRRLEE